MVPIGHMQDLWTIYMPSTVKLDFLIEGDMD